MRDDNNTGNTRDVGSNGSKSRQPEQRSNYDEVDKDQEDEASALSLI